MKLTPIFSIKTLGDNKCFLCKIPFIIQYPFGGDFTSCPICGWDPYQKAPKGHFDNDEDYYLYEEPNDAYYCFTCNIIFRPGACHYIGGCTDNIDHAELYVPKDKEITKFSDIQIPVFTSFEEANEFLQKEETKENYEWICLSKLYGKNKICPRNYK